MKFHLVAPPQTQTTFGYSLDGFTVATINFARILRMLGHHVILYGSEETDAPCNELVTILTKAEQQTLLAGSQYQYAAFDNRYAIWQEANRRTIAAIQSRKQPRDFICSIGGTAQKEIAEAHPDLMFVEFSIGYIGSFAPYRVYESESWRNTSQAKQGQIHGRFFDTVIPYFFDAAQFKFNPQKEDFLLYVGRLTPAKGIGVACKAARAAGLPLKVVGHGDASLLSDGAEYLGALNNEERGKLMGRARALIAPTQYIEPFGSVVVEAALCGTPAITTDFGAFTETVEQGVTGFRCNYLGEFVRAAEQAKKLEPVVIRARAVAKYSLEAVAPQYQDYFDRLNLLWGDGWDSLG
jgi:glycosyltransferase involved in cell wall biosynthesis